MTSNLDLYKQMHEAGAFRGNSTAKWSDKIKGMIGKTGATRLLDYGCGKGAQYHEDKINEEWGVPIPRLYDPAVPALSSRPRGTEIFDGVLCLDVLEHLEGEDLDRAIDDCLYFAKQFVFFGICTRAAKKHLPDGRNAHLTIQPREWWIKKIRSRLGPHLARLDDDRVLMEFDE